MPIYDGNDKIQTIMVSIPIIDESSFNSTETMDRFTAEAGQSEFDLSFTPNGDSFSVTINDVDSTSSFTEDDPSVYSGSDLIGGEEIVFTYNYDKFATIQDLVEIREVRLGNMPLFPDSVGQLNLNGFTVTNSDGSEFTPPVDGTAGASLSYTVTGQPGATFLVDAVSVGISIGSSIITLDSSGIYSQGFTVIGQGQGAGSRQVTLRLLPTGSTGLEEGLETLINIPQAAGVPAPSLNMSAGYGWYSGVTQATVSPSSGPSTTGTQFTVTLPSGMFSPPSGWVVAQVQWGDRNYLDETYDGIYATSEGIAAGETPLPDSFGVPQGLPANSYRVNTYTFNSDGTGSSYSSNGTVVYRHTSGEREGRAYTVRYTFTD